MSDEKLKEAVEAEMLIASRRMSVQELNDSKSPEYMEGYYAGVKDEAAFSNALLSPMITRLNETIDLLLES